MAKLLVRLQGKLPGTFLLIGSGGQIPDIPGNKRREAWLQKAEESMLGKAQTLRLNESASLGSPDEIASFELKRVSTQGSKVIKMSAPVMSQPILDTRAVDEFCSTTLLQKNTGSLAKAKARGKETILVVVVEYPFGFEELAQRIRGIYIDHETSNIDNLYLVSTWESEEGSLLLRQVF